MLTAPWITWLDDTVGTWRTGRRCLVLCRDRATLALVRRWAARKGGLLGLEAATPAGLAMQVLRHPVLAGPLARPPVEEALPAHTEIAGRIGDRPGLAGAARRWVQHLRMLARVGAPHRPPRWLAELAATEYGRDSESAALEAFLDAVKAHGKSLSSSATWDRVVAIGFDRPAAAMDPWEPWLVAALTGHRPAPPPVEARPIASVTVPDVAAEARVAVRFALDDPDGTLILVQDHPTARRVRDALARNGLGCTYKDSEALAVHELASAVRRCAAWFTEPPDPPIPLADLAFVLSRTSLGRALHPAAEAVVATLAGTAEVDRPTRGALVAALESTRLLDGPLSLWRRRIDERLDEARQNDPRGGSARSDLRGGSARSDLRGGSAPLEPPGSDPRGAARLAPPGSTGILAGVAVRLALLAAALGARPVEDVLRELTGAPIAFDADDFEDVVATLLGEAPGASLPAGSKLGAIQRFLLSCRVRLHDDPVARAIVGALRERSEWPVSASHVHHALAGAVDLGILTDGVDLVLVEEYDDRPCRQLLILDTHDHGIARGTTPDPLLDDDEVAAMGTLGGRHVVDERLRLVHRAVLRAERALAIVTERDAGGREVVAPIQLDLQPIEEVLAIESYGLGLRGLPESRPPPIRAATTTAADAPLPPPAASDPAVTWLAVQATAEWFREGRAVGQAARAPEPNTLAEIRRREGSPPPFVRPYLGYAEAPEAVLPPGPHSVSRLLHPLARCGYQAFGGQILRIRERQEIADDLDPRELGSVVHQALELVGSALRRAETEEEQLALVERLRGATSRAFAAAVGQLGTLSDARRTAVDGHRARWNGHWSKYVRSRARLPQSPGARAIEEHPAFVPWVGILRQRVPSVASASDDRLRGWVVATAREAPREWVAVSPSLVAREGERDALPLSAVPDLLEILRSPEWFDLHRTVVEALDRMEVWKLPPFASAAEVPFGEEGAAPSPVGGEVPEGTALSLGPTSLKLGQGEIALRGRIDRVDFVTSDAGERFAGVTDYKTGAERVGWQFRKDQRTLRDPQLLVYAMVLEKAAADGRLPEVFAGTRTAVIAHDRLKQVVDDADASSRDDVRAVDTWMPVDRKWLGWAARELGLLVDDARAGRWPLRPRADACPALASYGAETCPLAGACRIRGLPPSVEP